jgi:hypothetical protein
VCATTELCLGLARNEPDQSAAEPEPSAPNAACPRPSLRSLSPPAVHTCSLPLLGVRTRGLDIAAYLRREAADRAARDEALCVVERWNSAVAAGRDIWWSPTIRAAIVAGMPWADIHCPGCHTNRSLDLRTIDRHPLASVGCLVLGLRCTWWQGSAPCRRSWGCMQCHRRQQQASDPQSSDAGERRHHVGGVHAGGHLVNGVRQRFDLGGVAFG